MTKQLQEGKVKQIIKKVKSMASPNQESQKLIDYYESNQSRMDYPYYTSFGTGIIGSGAIESAHRTIVQKRLK